MYFIRIVYFCVTDILQNNPKLHRTLRDLTPGWGFISRQKDVSDVEWSTWKFFIQTSWYYLIIQFVISELIRNTKISLLKYWYILSSILYILLHLGYKHLLIVFAQPVMFATIILSGGTIVSIWVTSIILLVSYNSLKYKYFFWRFLEHKYLQDEEVYLILFGVAWIELRCISFCIDYIHKQKKMRDKYQNLDSKLETISNMFSYVLYAPLLYVGPIMLYEDFEKSFSMKYQRLSIRLQRFFLDMVLFLTYTFMLDLSFHYMYFYAMQSNIEVCCNL